MPDTEDNKNTPPPYDSLGPSKEEIDAIEKLWDKQRAEDWTKSRKPNMSFTFESRICRLARWNPKRLFRNREKEPYWAAVLTVSAQNIPQLMLHGFYWSHQDLIRGAGNLCTNDWSVSDGPKTPTRTYQYTSRELRNQMPLWYARLVVISEGVSVLKDFDLNWITEDTITRARAWNWAGKDVYCYDEAKERYFNVIYDRMPTRGWWPRPRVTGEEAQSLEKGGNGPEEIEKPAKKA